MTDQDGAADVKGRDEHPGKPTHYKIKIDRTHYEVDADQLSGAQLRALPTPAVGEDRDLFEVVPGQSDRKISDTDVAQISNGKRFFTAPSTINPGAGA